MPRRDPDDGDDGSAVQAADQGGGARQRGCAGAHDRRRQPGLQVSKSPSIRPGPAPQPDTGHRRISQTPNWAQYVQPSPCIDVIRTWSALEHQHRSKLTRAVSKPFPVCAVRSGRCGRLRARGWNGSASQNTWHCRSRAASASHRPKPSWKASTGASHVRFKVGMRVRGLGLVVRVRVMLCLV